MRWLREDLAWAAGVIEGEGSIFRYKNADACWGLSVGMTDKDIIERLHSLFGLGKIRGPYVVSRQKPLWTWRVLRRREVYAILAAIWCWLGLRRREKARAALIELPPAYGRRSYPPRIRGRWATIHQTR